MEIILWFDMQAEDSVSKERSKNMFLISHFHLKNDMNAFMNNYRWVFLSSNDAQLRLIYI